jgi:curved DNA-binding protein
MRRAETLMTLDAARATLGVKAMAPASEIRRAFREAAKRAHPDREGGAPDAFRQVVEAYRRLNSDMAVLPARQAAPPAPSPVLPWRGGRASAVARPPGAGHPARWCPKW